MKETLSVISMMVGLSFAVSAFADEHDHGTKQAPSAGEVKKSGRKKRQIMCKDCGKPEVNCDCPEELKKKEREEAAKQSKEVEKSE